MGPIFKGQAVRDEFFLDCSTLAMGQIECPETSITRIIPGRVTFQKVEDVSYNAEYA
jgi:hypothetical protein